MTSGPSEAPEALDEQALLQALRAVRTSTFPRPKGGEVSVIYPIRLSR